MKPANVKRHLANLATLLSALLLSLVLATWARSYFAWDEVCFQSTQDRNGVQRYVALKWQRGLLVWWHNHIVNLDRPMADQTGWHLQHGPALSSAWSDGYGAVPLRLGFGFSPPRREFADPCTWWHYQLIVPHYALAMMAAVAPSAWLLKRVRPLRCRRPPGACGSCGYDLRATPGRCPECGSGYRQRL